MKCTNDFCGECECRDAFCWLIDALINNIQNLEAKIVKTRFDLSCFTQYPYSSEMRRNIFSDLSACYIDYPAYQVYMDFYHSNEDPMASDKWSNSVLKLAKLRREDLY